MAFNAAYLQATCVFGTPAKINQWLYVTTDAASTVFADGYFDTAGDSSFNIGDIVVVLVVDSLVNASRTSAQVYVMYISSV